MRWPRYNVSRQLRKMPPEQRARALDRPPHRVPESIPKLTYTENSDRYVALRHHTSFGQIAPHVMKRMRTDDLEYIAGASRPDEIPPGVPPAERQKLVENGARAARILQQRAQVRSTAWSAFFGAGVGGMVAAIVSRL